MTALRKPGFCVYSFHNSLAKGKTTDFQFLDEVVEMGSVGAVMTVYWFRSTDPADLRLLLPWRRGAWTAAAQKA